MPVKKKPAVRRHKGPAILPQCMAEGKSLTLAFHYVVTEGNCALPAGDPESCLVEKGSWSFCFKVEIIEVLERTENPHFPMSAILDVLPGEEKNWSAKHKCFAILCMRVCLGQNWLHKIKDMVKRRSGGDSRSRTVWRSRIVNL